MNKRLTEAIKACKQILDHRANETQWNQATASQHVEMLLCDIDRIHGILTDEPYFDYEQQHWVDKNQHQVSSGRYNVVANFGDLVNVECTLLVTLTAEGITADLLAGHKGAVLNSYGATGQEFSEELFRSDESCPGVIGEDGRCSQCGEEIRDERPPQDHHGHCPDESCPGVINEGHCSHCGEEYLRVIQAHRYLDGV